MSITLGILGILLAIVDVYMPDVKTSIEDYIDQQAEDYKPKLRRALKLMMWVLIVGVIGVIVAILVGYFYEPEVSLPEPSNLGEVFSNILTGTIAYIAMILLAIGAVLMFTFGIMSILILIMIPFLIAPMSHFLNLITRGHAFAGLGLVLGAVALLMEWVR